MAEDDYFLGDFDPDDPPETEEERQEKRRIIEKFAASMRGWLFRAKRRPTVIEGGKK